MSRDYQEAFLKQQIEEYEQLLHDGASRDATRAQVKQAKLFAANHQKG